MSTGSRRSDRNPLALEMCSCSSRTIRVLESPVRRQVMSALLERRRADLAELAARLDPPAESTRAHNGTGQQHALGTERRHSMAIALHHTHLPKLEAAGLVSFDRDAAVVELELHPDIYGGPLTEHLLDSVDHEVWAAAAAVHRDRRRGAVLSLLAEAGPTQSVEYLASRLAETPIRATGRAGEPERETKTDVEVALHHVHLPVLDGVELVDYDVGGGDVTYTGGQWFELTDFVGTLPPRMRSEF